MIDEATLAGWERLVELASPAPWIVFDAVEHASNWTCGCAERLRDALAQFLEDPWEIEGGKRGYVVTDGIGIAWPEDAAPSQPSVISAMARDDHGHNMGDDYLAMRRADAAFITTTRGAFPRLLAAYRQQAAELAELKQEHHDYAEHTIASHCVMEQLVGDAEAELARLQPVIAAAIEWRKTLPRVVHSNRRLISAVDRLEGEPMGLEV